MTQLELLQTWQGPALDALAAWLGEDPGRMEPRLRQQDAVQRFVSLFASYSQNADSEALARLLDPFLRIMKRSRKITVCFSHFAGCIELVCVIQLHLCISRRWSLLNS